MQKDNLLDLEKLDTKEIETTLSTLAREKQALLKRVAKEFPGTYIFVGASSRNSFQNYDEEVKELNSFIQALAPSVEGIVTGGGPGLMQAINKSAHDAGIRSLALTTPFPNEAVDPFVEEISCTKVTNRMEMLLAICDVVMTTTGGLGTLQELCHLSGQVYYSTLVDKPDSPYELPRSVVYQRKAPLILSLGKDDHHISSFLNDLEKRGTASKSNIEFLSSYDDALNLILSYLGQSNSH